MGFYEERTEACTGFIGRVLSARTALELRGLRPDTLEVSPADLGTMHDLFPGIGNDRAGMFLGLTVSPAQRSAVADSSPRLWTNRHKLRRAYEAI